MLSTPRIVHAYIIMLSVHPVEAEEAKGNATITTLKKKTERKTLPATSNALPICRKKQIQIKTAAQRQKKTLRCTDPT